MKISTARKIQETLITTAKLYSRLHQTMMASADGIRFNKKVSGIRDWVGRCGCWQTDSLFLSSGISIDYIIRYIGFTGRRDDKPYPHKYKNKRVIRERRKCLHKKGRVTVS